MNKLSMLAAASASGGCATTLQLQPQIPPSNGEPRMPMKVALLVPPATRGLTETALLPTGCLGGLSFNPAPQGEIFAQTAAFRTPEPSDSAERAPDAPSSGPKPWWQH